MTIIGDAWDEIRISGTLAHGWNARRIHAPSPCNIFAALRQPDFTPAILIEIESRTVPASFRFPGSIGFAVHPETVTPGPHGRVRLCLVLSENRYSDVFEVLAEDVAGAVGGTVSDAEGIRVFVARLNIWQAFMQKHGPDGLGMESQTGLFSELFLFEKLMDFLPAGNIVDSWKGPDNGIHDFDFGGRCVEVKSSSSPTRPGFTVSSLMQLDETRVALLLLCHMMLDITSGKDGNTLPELIERIRGRMEKEDVSSLVRFDGLLIRAGYLDSQENLYRSRHFHVSCLQWFRVMDDFPRIRPIDTRRGIVSASYQVSVDSCSFFVLDEPEVAHLLMDADNG